MLFSLAAGLALVALSTASPLKLRTPYAVKESHFVPRQWTEVEPAKGDGLVNLKIALYQSRFEELEKHLYEVSDPSHVRYGQHLSSAEVNELIKPSDDALAAVHSWLADCGVETASLKYSQAKDWIKVVLPISKVEEILETKYSKYMHEDGSELIRATEWSLPLHLHEHIATIQPTTSFLRPKANGRTLKIDEAIAEVTALTGADASACNEALVTPGCLRSLYGTIDYKVQAADKNSMALNDFLGEVNLRTDARQYLQMYRPDAVAGADEFQQVSVAGGTLQQTPLNATELQGHIGIEGNLDAQTMLGIAWPTPLTAFSTGGLDPSFIPDTFTPTNSDEPFVAWLQYVLSLPDSHLPKIVSTSYGDDEQTIAFSYAKQACDMFAQLGARGVTVLFSSGDQGVGEDDACFSNDGKNSSTFLPAFPASCPYVTVVGGTKGFNPEVASLDARFAIPFTSGGGFSNYFPRPKYQDAAVTAYLKQTVGGQYAGLYNPNGRGYPDIAAQSQNFSTVWNGTVRPTDGTSCSVPTASAVLALVNDALLAAGKPTLGFINPWLYAGGYKAFTDILSGSSAGCNTNGFPAAPGWDAVTGFGTPIFPSIVKAVEGKSGW